MTDVLVVGYGNDLRSDDGAGRRVADAVAGIADVLSVPQLTPELALAVADRDTVVFVDADVDVTRLTVRPVESIPGQSVMTHHGSPAALLALVPEVGSAPGEAWMLSIPASNLDLGEELSPRTRVATEAAIEWIRHLVRGGRPLFVEPSRTA